MRWWIGGCVLDTTRRELTRAGVQVRVEPKVLDLINELAEAGGAMVTKAQLRARIWPDAHVTPASLRRLVKEARRALGENGRRPDPIVTIHGRGYRLAVPALPEDEG